MIDAPHRTIHRYAFTRRLANTSSRTLIPKTPRDSRNSLLYVLFARLQRHFCARSTEYVFLNKYIINRFSWQIGKRERRARNKITIEIRR